MTERSYVRCICTRGVQGKEWDRLRPCILCRGRGEVTLRAIAELTGEHRSTYVRLMDPKRTMRSETAARVFRNLVRVFLLADSRALDHLDPVPVPPPVKPGPVLLGLLE